MLPYFRDGLKKTGNIMQIYLDMISKRPNLKAVVSNFTNRAYIVFIDPELIKEVTLNKVHDM